MMFDLPDPDSLYQALLDRDPRYEGQVYVCVASTGIFCRLTCPARKPKRENCSFKPTAGECIAAGFRPCKRCHPVAASEPLVAQLLAALEDDPARRWSEDQVRALGLEPSTVRRVFLRQFGMTFLDLARQRRLGLGFTVLEAGERVIDAQLEAGFASPSAFRAAFARLLGCPPGELVQGGLLRASWIATPLGDMVAVASATHLHLLEFVDRKALPTELRRLRAGSREGIGLGRTAVTDQAQAELMEYFAGRSARFETLVHQLGSGFSQRVWEELREIPAGETRSYSEIARRIGRPEAVRAAARANGANQIALMVPCHRVIGADGALTGYGGGLWRKDRLLEIERKFRAV